MLGADGALYGTTGYGGNTCGHSGCGTVYQLSPSKTSDGDWTYGVIHYFTAAGSGVADGTNPAAGLIADQQGVLYGTTSGGGLYGNGTVFKLVPDTGDGWKESVINNFGSKNGDGTDPTAGLIFDASGALYGTTYEGGANGYGTIFTLTPPGKDETLWPETVLYSFAGGSDGAYPLAGLALDDPSEGGLYGTTTYGGANCDVSSSCGTVFRLGRPASDEAPWTLSTLHSFSYNSSDGQYPVSGVMFGEDGALYGTTQYGGVWHRGTCGLLLNCGTIFTLTTDDSDEWKESVLYRFCDEAKYDYLCTTGAYPTASLLAYKGFLYGTTSFQGDGYLCNCGTVFLLGSVPSLAVPEPESLALIGSGLLGLLWFRRRLC